MKTLQVEKKKGHHPQCLAVLEAYFQDLPVMGVEIGTNAGDLTRTILRDRPVSILFTIDPWESRPGDGYEAGQPQEYHNEQEAAARAKLEPYKGKVEIIKMTSDEAFEILRGLKHIDRVGFDFVWIDGHHSEEQVRRDIANYWQLVRPGGILGGHDYNLVPDVTKVVDEFMVGREWQTGGDFTWWTQK